MLILSIEFPKILSRIVLMSQQMMAEQLNSAEWIYQIYSVCSYWGVVPLTTSFGDEIESFLFPILPRSLHLRREQLTKYKALTIKRLDQCKYVEKLLFTQHVCMKKIEFMIIKPYWERIEMCATANIAQLEFLFKEKHSLLQKKVQRHSAKASAILFYVQYFLLGLFLSDSSPIIGNACH